MTFLNIGKYSKINLFVGGLCGVAALTITKLPLFSYIVFNAIYNNENEENMDPEEIELEEIDWESKYPKQDDDYENAHKLAYSKLTERKNMVYDVNFVIENIPFWGDTRLNYNKNQNTFEYYNDRGGSIPYKMLSSLARYYVVEFDCKELYIDMDNELKKSENVLEEFQKKYKNIKLNEEKKNEILIKNKIMKFKYMGSIKEFNSLKEKEKKIEPESKNISFADFKKLNK